MDEWMDRLVVVAVVLATIIVILTVQMEYRLTTTSITIENKWLDIEDQGMWGIKETLYFSDVNGYVYCIDKSKKVSCLFIATKYDDIPKVRFENLQVGEIHNITYSNFLGIRLSKEEKKTF